MPRNSQSWTRIGLALVIGLLVIGAGVFLVPMLAAAKLDNTQVAFEILPSCDGPSGHASTSTTQVSHAWDGPVLVATVHEYENCASRVKAVSASTFLGRIVLEIEYFLPGGIPTACNCEHVTRVRLSGLEARSYEVRRSWF